MKKFYPIFFTLTIASLPFSGKTAAPHTSRNLIVTGDPNIQSCEVAKKVAFPSLNKELYLQRMHYRLLLQRL